MREIYLIDSSILINFSIFTPIKYHPKFWQELADQVRRGNIIILDAIRDECQGNFFKRWFKEVPGSIVKVGEDIKSQSQSD